MLKARQGLKILHVVVVQDKLLQHGELSEIRQVAKHVESRVFDGLTSDGCDSGQSQ